MKPILLFATNLDKMVVQFDCNPQVGLLIDQIFSATGCFVL